MASFNRPKLEDFLADTIPPVRFLLTEFFFERVTEVTLALVEKDAGPVVLDAASGMGIDSCILARRGFKVIAMEPMKRMVGFSRSYHAKNGQFAPHCLGYAEEIPLRSESVDQVLCKGSIDHFLDPRLALNEMKRVLKPGGKIIVAAANYDSLSCHISKAIYWYQHRVNPPTPNELRPHHEIPTDHITRFNAEILRRMVGEFFVIRKELGIGALWGAPYINMFFDWLPRPLARAILLRVFAVAQHFPGIADMTALVGEKCLRRT